MTNKYFVPLIMLGTAVGQIRRGEDGFAIALLCFVAACLLTFWFFDVADENRERKRREEESAKRRSRF